MSELLNLAPYGPRSDGKFLDEMNALTLAHLQGCPLLPQIWPRWKPARSVADLPFLHVGLFKNLDLRTEGDGIRHERTLESSSTTGTQPSRIPLDTASSELQSKSVVAILRDFIGAHKRPLLIVDSARSLRSSSSVPARIAAAMSLRPLATDIYFLLDEAADPASVKWDLLRRALDSADELMVYGLTAVLWQAWANGNTPDDVAHLLARKRITFLHSGGWKKLQSIQVTREQFDDKVAGSAGPGSRVIDFYGLVEQVGVIYPLCEHGSRHVPVWADVLVRDPFTLQPLDADGGQLALLNCLARGGPYHSILTEDLGRLLHGPCACGRSGKRFELLGRIPKAEMRGCANV